MGGPNESFRKDVAVEELPLSPLSDRHQEIRGSSSFSAMIQGWTATALVVSYFVFSIALYTVLDQEATKVFWFLYLTIATLVAGTTALEAYDGLTPLKDARNATAKFEKDGQKFKTSEDALPLVELVFDLQDGDLEDLKAIKQVRNSLLYPSSLIRINVLCHDRNVAHVLANDFDSSLEMAGVRIHLIPPHAMASLSARLVHFLSAVGPMAASIMAVFAGDQRPHPHAMRIAVERMKQDAKVDVLQGRTVRVPQARRSSFFASLANIEHDMVYALLQPGRAITWTLNVANDTNTYWRTEALRAATSATIGVPRTGHDLGFMAAARGVKTVTDLGIVCFEPCPFTYAGYLYTQASEARQWVLATARYTSLAFKKHGTPDGTTSSKWTLKARFGIIYELIILRLGSHAIAQYLSMALALLFTRAPSSTLQFSYLIYFPYTISEWLIIAGLICLLCTVFMIHQARSEFVPSWTALVLVVGYPILLVFRAVVDIYAQLDILVT